MQEKIDQMDKMKMQTNNIADQNYEILSKLFPNALTETITGYDEEGNPIIERAIDADVLRQEISCKVVEGRDERYQFTWPDKKQSILLANAPISATLRPCREESVDFDYTENLYIEGDNLEVLKLLQETYLGKVKVIYIDPPYNTGKDFVYKDNYAKNSVDYIIGSGQTDEEGNQLVLNLESNGRFHTDWLNMIYPRLKLSKNILTDDGFIFVSIDDNEVENLRKVMDEIFGEDNFVAQFAWKRKKEISNDSSNVAIQGEYILCYRKSIEGILQLEPLSEEYIDKSYKEPTKEFPLGKWRPVPLTVSKGLSGGGYQYTITTPAGIEHNRLWAYPQKSFEKLLKDGLVYFGKNGDGVPQRVMYAKDSKGQPVSNYWDDVATNKEGKKEILDLFGDNYFETPKPVKLIEKILNIASDEDAIILDFFAGSSTTAQAILNVNKKNRTKMKFILVQVPEKIEKDTVAGKDGFSNLCEIGIERIKRGSKKYISDNQLDTGFRVLKLDSSNLKDVYYNPSEIKQQSLFESTDNIKEDRTPEDLLFQVMLDLGVLLSSKIEEKEIAGKKVFNVDDGFLVACFDNDITEETVKAVAKMAPYYAVFRDSCMANDSVATNFDQIFATYSPSTVRKVL